MIQQSTSPDRQRNVVQVLVLKKRMSVQQGQELLKNARQIINWTSDLKISAAINTALPKIPSGMRQLAKGLASPESIAILSGVAGLWAAAHLAGIGFVMDAAIGIAGLALLGKDAIVVWEHIVRFTQIASAARTSQDLDVAAEELATGLSLVTFDVVASVVGVKFGQIFQKTARNFRQSDAFNKPSVTQNPDMRPGEGFTDSSGNVEVSSKGTAIEQALVLNHELVHSILSPKLKFLQDFRADIAWTGYERSHFLRYLEEALAEGYAQFKVKGIKNLPEALSFPFNNGYNLKISRVIGEGALGTVVFGGLVYGAYVVANSGKKQ